MPPIANDDQLVTDEDVDAAINVLTNDVDPMLGSLSVITLGRLPEHGMATFLNNGRVVYRPNDNFFGTDSFTYVVQNIGELRSTATVHVNVRSVNDPTLISAPTTASVNEDETITFSQANDNAIAISDVDIGTEYLEVQLTFTGGSIHLGSTTGLVGDQKDNVNTFVGQLSAVNGALEGLTFTPDHDYFGPAALEIRVKDLSLGAGDPTAIDRHTVSITVQSVNDPPVARNDQFFSEEDDFLNGNLLLDNGEGPDFDVDGDALLVASTPAIPPSHGQLKLVPDGSFTYLPDPNYHGSDSFEYSVSDPDGATATAMVMIDVAAINDAPVNDVPVELTAYEDVPLPIAGISVSDVDVAEGNGLVKVRLAVGRGTLRINPTVPGGLTAEQIHGSQTSTIVLSGTPEAINVTMSASDGLTYVPALNFHGIDKLRVETGDLGNFGAPGPLGDVDTVVITVLSAEQQITNLSSTIYDLVVLEQISQGNGKSLIVKLANVQSRLQKGPVQAAINMLNAFQQEVESLLEDEAISTETATLLSDAVERILAGLELDE